LSSKTTRVQPVFTWLEANGGSRWPTQLVQLAHGFAPDLGGCGSFVNMELEREREVRATKERLRWMLENVDGLVPTLGKKYEKLQRRVANRQRVQEAIAILSTKSAIPRDLILEGGTHADCLTECKDAFIWIEGKRFDCLASGVKWDVSRDQLARNVEAAWSVAQAAGKDYRLLIIHEHRLRHHEIALIDGYRAGTWSAGWPHISEDRRREFAKRIGTVTWAEIAREWPQLRTLPQLHDLQI
jgi:hypothetical protein